MGEDLTQHMAADWDTRAISRSSAIRWILDMYDGPEEAFWAQGGAHWVDMLHALSLKGITIPKDAIGAELGCGIGRMTVLMARYFKHLYATDVSQNMISLAPRVENVTYIVTGTLEDVPEPVDFVMSHLVLQHMPKSSCWKYLDEAHDILKSGGVFITQLHETSEPVEHADSTILVRGYTQDELREGLDESKWEIVSLLEPAGISEVWRWLILRKP